MRTTEHLGRAADRAKLLRRAADRAKLRRERVATQLSGAMSDPAAVVRALLAVQAQDYRASLWAIALRTPEGTEADVERAIEARAIVRTWPMRGTLHFVPAEDARWMLRLLAPRLITKSAARHRELELDEAILDPAHAARTRNGIMSPVVVIEGRIAGVWSRAAKKGEVVVRIELFAPVGRSLLRELERAAARYGVFLACPARLDLTAHPS